MVTDRLGAELIVVPPDDRWNANARDVADALTRLADEHQPRLVMLSGDVRAVQFLRDQLPARVTDLLAEVQGDYRGLQAQAIDEISEPLWH